MALHTPFLVQDIRSMKTAIKVGDRIRLLSMVNDPDPIPVGSLGTVVAIHDHRNWCQVEVDWDSGRSLMLSLPPDQVAVIDG